MAGDSILPHTLKEEEPSTWGMVLSTVITILTLLGLLFCFRRASTLFPRSISIPLDHFMNGQRTNGRGPIALTDDDWRDAEALEDGLYIDGEGEDYEGFDVNSHHHRPTADARGSRPLLPLAAADTTNTSAQRFSLEMEGESDDDDDDGRELLGVSSGQGGEEQQEMVYDIGSDEDDEGVDETAIRERYKDDDEGGDHIK